MEIEISKLNKNIQKRLSNYLEAITEDFVETYITDKETVNTLDKTITSLKKIKNTLKEMHNLCLEALPLDMPQNLEILFEKEQKYNEFFMQLNGIVAQTTDGTINLLAGQNLKINLDDDDTSGVVITGFDASTKGLGLNIASWKDATLIKKTVTELNLANKTVNQFLQIFYNYNLIIITWEDFIKNLISILKESVLDSVLFDLNTEQAHILALQTAQKMTRNSLLAANQTTQNILKLI